MKNMDRFIFGCFILTTLCFTIDAQACSASLWDGGSSGAVAVGSPTTIPRVSEFCGLSVTGIGHVQDNSASDTRIIVRFYVLAALTGTGTVDLFEAYGDQVGTTAIFKVSYDGSDFIFDATDAPGGSSFTIAANSGWNLIELDWTSGGDFIAWVDADTLEDPQPTPSGPVDAGTGTVESIRLGAPNGFGGFSGGSLTYDSYESHRNQPVGALLIGDANGSDSINVFDMVSQQNEILGNALAPGQPDCNLSGTVNVFDLVCVQNIILGN
jgi:hypothetical protein